MPTRKPTPTRKPAPKTTQPSKSASANMNAAIKSKFAGAKAKSFPASASKSPTEPGSVTGIAHRRIPKSAAGATAGMGTLQENRKPKPTPMTAAQKKASTGTSKVSPGVKGTQKPRRGYVPPKKGG